MAFDYLEENWYWYSISLAVWAISAIYAHKYSFIITFFSLLFIFAFTFGKYDSKMSKTETYSRQDYLLNKYSVRNRSKTEKINETERLKRIKENMERYEGTSTGDRSIKNKVPASTKCEFCKTSFKKIIPFQCNYCYRYYCGKCRLPEDHDCALPRAKWTSLPKANFPVDYSYRSKKYPKTEEEESWERRKRDWRN